MRKFVLSMSFFGCLTLLNVSCQTEEETPKEARVILITMDGLRWKELFTGADSLLIAHAQYVQDSAALKSKFWRADPQARRKALMPFVWDSIATFGQLYGNREYDNKVDLTNQHFFSYPGYNEILTGTADDKRIHSNNKINNPNITFLEKIASLYPQQERVAAFGSWDVFPFIINEERSKIPVNAGFEIAHTLPLSEREAFLNTLQEQIPSPWGSVRLDAFTHHFALEYLQKKTPLLTYIAYGETDDFAHDGEYDAYLESAHTTDDFLKDLWAFTQKHPLYKNNTLFLVTTDHGRGMNTLDSWRSHGAAFPETQQTWLMAYGKGIAPRGEMKEKQQWYNNQIAASLLRFLGAEDLVTPKMGAALPFVEAPK